MTEQGHFQEKPVVVFAARWHKNGDHPEDGQAGEGKIVRYFRRPDVSGETRCRYCGLRMHDHGWIDTVEGGHIVCPGDWIITGVQGERYPCKPDIFLASYEQVFPASASLRASSRSTQDEQTVGEK